MATDAALGKAFDQLFNLFKENIVKVVTFKSTLNEIKSKLISLEPVIRDITKLKMALDQTGGTTENLESLMKEGLELVGKCLKLKKWKLWRRGQYCDKLSEFNEKLQKEIQALPVEITKDGKLTLLHVNETLEIVRENSMVTRGLSNKSDETLGVLKEMNLNLKQVLELNKAAKDCSSKSLQNQRYYRIIFMSADADKKMLQHICRTWCITKLVKTTNVLKIITENCVLKSIPRAILY